MQNDTRTGTSTVINLDRGDFDSACASLMHMAADQCRPDVLIGIRSGGYHVAESMSRASNDTVPVLAVTCKRPSTKLKEATDVVRQILGKLPRGIVDWLRTVEHR